MEEWAREVEQWGRVGGGEQVLADHQAGGEKSEKNQAGGEKGEKNWRREHSTMSLVRGRRINGTEW